MAQSPGEKKLGHSVVRWSLMYPSLEGLARIREHSKLVGGLEMFGTMEFLWILSDFPWKVGNGMSSSQLTKSIIFQRGRAQPPTSKNDISKLVQAPFLVLTWLILTPKSPQFLTPCTRSKPLRMYLPSDTMRAPIWWIVPPRAAGPADAAVAVVAELPDVSASPRSLDLTIGR